MRWFVTGTDTGVGKTTVSVALLRRARELGYSAAAFKPIETGGTADQEALGCRAVYSLRQPAAPYVAARAEHVDIDLGRVVASVPTGTDVLLVEGAGGWRVPITGAVDMAGLARMLGLPVLVVARAGLGTINHSLLTVEAVERDGLAVSALVLSERPDDDQGFTDSNVAQIALRWPGRIVVYRGLTSLDALFAP